MTTLTSSTANSLRLAILLTLANGFIDAYTFIARAEFSPTSRPPT